MQPQKPKTEVVYVTQTKHDEDLAKLKKEIIEELLRKVHEIVSGLAARLIKNLPEMLTSAIVEVAPWIKPSAGMVRGAMKQEFSDLLPRRQPNQNQSL